MYPFFLFFKVNGFRGSVGDMYMSPTVVCVVRAPSFWVRLGLGTSCTTHTTVGDMYMSPTEPLNPLTLKNKKKGAFGKELLIKKLLSSEA